MNKLENEITSTEKEASALAVMQRALENYSKRKGISYEEALVEFSKSGTYEELFDFDSLLWTQGPDYLMSVYEAEECNKAGAC